MKRLKIKFVNTQAMVAFVKRHRGIIHNYDRESQILELYTEEDPERFMDACRCKILSLEYVTINNLN